MRIERSITVNEYNRGYSCKCNRTASSTKPNSAALAQSIGSLYSSGMGEFIDYSKRIQSARSSPQHSPKLEDGDEVGATPATSARDDHTDEQHLQPHRKPSRKKSRSSSRYRTAEEDEDGQVGEVAEPGEKHFLVRSCSSGLLYYAHSLIRRHAGSVSARRSRRRPDRQLLAPRPSKVIRVHRRLSRALFATCSHRQRA